MSTWGFAVTEIVVDEFAAEPQLIARLHVTQAEAEMVHAIALRCQVRIEPQRRGYDDQETIGLRGQFGDRDRWSQTLKPFLWMHCSTMVQGFRGDTEVDLPLPCTYDFDVVGSRYLHALEEGTAPLNLMFTGTVFTRGENGFGVEQLPWDAEARYDLPVAVWRQLIATHFPGKGWIRLDHDTIAALQELRSRRGHLSWDETVDELLEPTTRRTAETTGGTS
ncbi:MAG: hypothetical protein JWO46_1259 [Nocardioidaceae bacterium]|nr:hypothetical protein [Nocardioidaceae bacterium]